MPIRASPAFSMIALTSAKSRLMTPGCVTRSEMPCTPWRRTSSAIRKASSSVVFELATWASRALGMTMSASTWPRRALMPSSAVSLRIRPSKPNGRVTTPIVSAPASLASSATMDADPVPVPPPMPAVMNTMSDSWTTAESSVRLSSAASRPRVQSPPAPRPRVILLPIWTLTSAWQRSSACLSVLTAMNWTFRALETIRLTALPPPPPQPTTLIRARPSCSSLSFMTIRWSSLECALAMASSSWFFVCSLEKIAQPPHCFLVRGSERCGLARVAVHRACARSPLHKATGDGERRSVRLVGQSRQPERLAQAGRRVENDLRGVHRSHQPRPAAGDDDAGGQQLVETRLADLLARHLEDLDHARPDDLRQEAARQCLAVVELELLGLVQRRAQADRDVARDVVAADRQHGHVPRRAVVVDDDVGRPGADLDEAHAELDLLRRQHALARREPGAHHVLDIEARAVHALDHVLDRRLGAGDDVGLDLQAVAGHADGVADPVLAVDGVGARDDVDDLAVRGDADRAARLDHALHVVLTDLVVGMRDGDDAGRVLAPEVGAAQGDDDRFDAVPRHPLGRDRGGLDGGDRFVQVDDHAFAQAVRGNLSHPEDAHRSKRVVRFCDDHRDPARAEVKTDGFLPPRQDCAETPPGTWGLMLGGLPGLYRLLRSCGARFCIQGDSRAQE